MVTVVLFHSALGLRPAVTGFADRLRQAGHEVLTPDLYDGEAFDDLDAGVRKRDDVGLDQLLERARGAVAELPADVVYTGFSMGAAAAQTLALTRAGARGAILIDGAIPVTALGMGAWPPSVPVQVHATTNDPWFPRAELEEFLAAVPNQVLELHLHDGTGHLATDEAWADHDPEIARQTLRSVLDWLSKR